MTKQDVINLFDSKDQIKITFIKSDGTLRDMVCTRCLGVIPLKFHPKSHREITESLPVFDLEAEGWRAFRFDSLRRIDGVQV